MLQQRQGLHFDFNEKKQMSTFSLLSSREGVGQQMLCCRQILCCSLREYVDLPRLLEASLMGTDCEVVHCLLCSPGNFNSLGLVGPLGGNPHPDVQPNLQHFLTYQAPGDRRPSNTKLTTLQRYQDRAINLIEF